jgi:hypothetical protein
MSAAPWDKPGYEPLKLSDLMKVRRERLAAEKAASEPKPVRKSRPIPAAPASSLRKTRTAARPASPPFSERAAPSPEVVVKVCQDEPAVIEALGNLTKAVAALASRTQPAPVVNVEVPQRKTRTTTHRNEEGFITHTETEPIE